MTVVFVDFLKYGAVITAISGGLLIAGFSPLVCMVGICIGMGMFLGAINYVGVPS